MVKKAVVYTPIGNAANISSTYDIQKGITPPYEDSGVKYQGQYKKAININNNEYQLKPQTKAIYYRYWSNAASANITRASAARFICTGIFFCFDIAAFAAGSLQYIIKDGDYSSAPPNRNKFILNFNLVHSIFANNFLDLSGNPLIFNDTSLKIGISTNYLLGANDQATIILYGYEEND
jgi:hypothetical protein